MDAKKVGYLKVMAATKVTEYKDKNGEIIKIPFFETFPYPKSHVRRYHNCIMQLAGINGLARDLMDWLTIKMDNDNIVTNTEHYRESFIEYLKDAQKELGATFKYSIPTHRAIKGAFNLLTKRGMLIFKKRATYIVNPEYFMSSRNEKSRNFLIRMILEFRYDTHTKMKVIRENQEKSIEKESV